MKIMFFLVHQALLLMMMLLKLSLLLSAQLILPSSPPTIPPLFSFIPLTAMQCLFLLSFTVFKLFMYLN